MGFELGEGHFDWIEIRAVGRQEQEPSSAVANGFLGPGALMGGEIVEDDDVSRLEGRGQLGLDISFEDFAVHRRIDDEGRREACRCQGGDEGLRLPVTERCLGMQPLALQAAPAQPRHLGRRPSLVNEHQPVEGLPHPRLAMLNPFAARLADVWPVLFAGPQCFF